MDITTNGKKICDLYIEALKKRYAYSNCYFQLSDLESWLEEEKVSCWSLEQALVLLVCETGYTKLFFMSDDFAWLRWLEAFREKAPGTLTIEAVVRGEPGIYDFSARIPCREVVQYTRLRSSGQTAEYDGDDSLYCMESDFAELRRMMDHTFRPVGDHIPGDDELKCFLASGSVIGIRDNGSLAGFVIFEDMKKTSYIRMICVDEAFRGKGLGNELMRRYFSVHNGFKSFTLWCRVDNTPAMNLYKSRWNYREENLYNYIFIV